MALSMRYAFELVDTHWIRVPTVFPDGEAADVFVWAAGVADALAGGDAALHAAVLGRATEVGAVEGPRGPAAERLWHPPTLEHRETIAHLYFAEAEGAPVDAFALAGTGGMLQAMRPVETTRFEEALAAEVLVEADGGVHFVSRRIGRTGQLIALLEVIGGEATSAALEDGPLDELLRGLVVRS